MDSTISARQLQMLRLIDERGGMRTSNRNTDHHVAHSTADALRERGLVTMHLVPPSFDWHVEITDAGRSLLAKVRARYPRVA